MHKIRIFAVPARIAKWLVVTLLVSSLGGHWVLLQTAAWVGMTIDYSQTDGLGVALKKTFDGKHPCKLCRVIAQGKKSEEKKPPILTLAKIECVFDNRGFVLYPPSFALVASLPIAVASWAESPPLPPPRLFQS